jgi:hypothetical protein
MSFAVYSYLNKMPLTGTPIPYRFVLKTEYKYLLSNSLEKINVYYCGYNKLQATICKNFLLNKYRDGWIIVVGNNITCSYIVTYCRGTSVARSLKLLALPYPLSKNQSIENNIILSTNRSYVISPYETNID